MTEPTSSNHLAAVPRRHEPDPRQAIVAWFCSDRGFGQLRTDAGDMVYVCQQEVMRDGFRVLEAGQLVTWVPGSDVHGMVARQVSVVDEQGHADRARAS